MTVHLRITSRPKGKPALLKGRLLLRGLRQKCLRLFGAQREDARQGHLEG